MYKTLWREIAGYCEDEYGVRVEWEEECFDCCECGEPLYKGDFPNHDWKTCPICEYQFIEEGEEV